jgi:FkbM family methyltransferase
MAGDAFARPTSLLRLMSSKSEGQRFGTLQRDLPFLKDVVDYRLTRYPRLYLFVERFREWVNWDKRVYLSFVRRGDIVLDVGANVGAHAVFLSHMVRADGRVLAFEPLAPNVDALRETIRRRSRISNISIFQMAVGNPVSARQEVVIRAPGDDLTQASLKVQGAGSWEGRTSVREYNASLTRLDAEAEVQTLPSIDFIKIDVEGGELDVLKGATQTIQRHHPLIYCEVYAKWATSFGYTPADLLGYARSLGYTQARVICKGTVYALRLDRDPPPAVFETSSDVLFFADKHVHLVDAFDKRYLR